MQKQLRASPEHRPWLGCKSSGTTGLHSLQHLYGTECGPLTPLAMAQPRLSQIRDTDVLLSHHVTTGDKAQLQRMLKIHGAELHVWTPRGGDTQQKRWGKRWASPERQQPSAQPDPGPGAGCGAVWAAAALRSLWICTFTWKAIHPAGLLTHLITPFTRPEQPHVLTTEFYFKKCPVVHAGLSVAPTARHPRARSNSPQTQPGRTRAPLAIIYLDSLICKPKSSLNPSLFAQPGSAHTYWAFN